MNTTRRTFVTGVSALVGVQFLGAPFWRPILVSGEARPSRGPYGPLQPADANDLELPVGFTSRRVGRSGAVVPGTAHVWHGAPDGGGCFALPDGGWVYVSNAELDNGAGGVSAIRFDATGDISDAYSILSGTNRNCSGGTTPWGTWLSCEESGSGGRVFECDPTATGQGVVRPLLGRFSHEAAAVDPSTSEVYLTEDAPNGRLYKFVPTTSGDLSDGQLFAAVVTPVVNGAGAWVPPDGGTVSWVPTSAAVPDRQVATAAFNGGEGIHLGADVLFFTTKGDRRVWELDMLTSTLRVAYDCLAHPDGDLDAVDAVVVHPATQRVFVAEDGGNMELVVIAERGGRREVSSFCRFAGHQGSEVTGAAFSPDGTRLYLSSQRGIDGTTGVTLEITGPFDRPFDTYRLSRPAVAASRDANFAAAVRLGRSGGSAAGNTPL